MIFHVPRFCLILINLIRFFGESLFHCWQWNWLIKKLESWLTIRKEKTAQEASLFRFRFNVFRNRDTFVLNPAYNFWNVVTHLIAIFFATYYWSTDLGNKTAIFVESYVPRVKTEGDSTLHQWFSGIFTTNTPVLLTFLFYLIIFLILLELVYVNRWDIKENSRSASIILSIGTLAFNINTLILIYSCFAISLPTLGLFQGLGRRLELFIFGLVSLFFYFIFACFHQYSIDKFNYYIRSTQKIGIWILGLQIVFRRWDFMLNEK